MPVRRTIAVVSLLLGLASASPALLANAKRAHIAIRVYDSATLTGRQRAAALQVASSVLETADISTGWRDCPKGEASDRDASCASIPDSGEMVLRITRSGDPARPDTRRPLGYSLIDRGAAAGVFATVFIDRVDWLATASRTDATRLLGRAIAHEIGHLLLGSNAHARRGLMRATWTSEELTANRPADWMLRLPDEVMARLTPETSPGAGGAGSTARPSSQTFSAPAS